MAAAYHTPVLDPEKFRTKCRRVVDNLRLVRKNNPFDCIAFTGLSGSLIAPIVCSRMRVHMLPVRKECDDANSSHRVECLDYDDHKYRRALILDDFIDMGGTVKHIIRTLNQYLPSTQVMGIALHRRLDREPETLIEGGRYVVNKNDTYSLVLMRWFV